MRNDLDLPVSLLANGNRIAQVAHAIIDLDFIVEEFLKGSDVEDLVRGRLGGIDNEL